jgi:hypothetical protein
MQEDYTSFRVKFQGQKKKNKNSRSRALISDDTLIINPLDDHLFPFEQPFIYN